MSRKKILKYPLFWETSPGPAAFDAHGRLMYCTRLSRAAGYRDIDLLQMATCACNRYTWLTFRKLGECCSDEHRKQEEDSLHGGGRREAGGEPGLRSECRADWLAAVAAPFMYRGAGGGGGYRLQLAASRTPGRVEALQRRQLCRTADVIPARLHTSPARPPPSTNVTVNTHFSTGTPHRQTASCGYCLHFFMDASRAGSSTSLPDLKSLNRSKIDTVLIQPVPTR